MNVRSTTSARTGSASISVAIRGNVKLVSIVTVPKETDLVSALMVASRTPTAVMVTSAWITSASRAVVTMMLVNGAMRASKTSVGIVARNKTGFAAQADKSVIV